MSANNDIRKAIGELTRDKAPVYSVVCSVTNISEVEMTCDCTPLDGSAELLDVRLQAQVENGWALIPKDGSIVTVTMLNQTAGFVSQVSEIDKIVGYVDSGNRFVFSTSGFIWNDGTFGGMAKTGVIATKLNTQETAENALKIIISAILSAGSSSPATPVTNGTLAAFFTGYNVVPIVPTTQAEISDNKVKH